MLIWNSEETVEKKWQCKKTITARRLREDYAALDR